MANSFSSAAGIPSIFAFLLHLQGNFKLYEVLFFVLAFSCSSEKDFMPASGPLHMIPVDRAVSVTEMKLVSVHMATCSPLSEMKNLKKW